MPYLRIANIRVDVTEPEEQLPRWLANRLRLGEADVARWRILRKSLDARSRYDLKFVYTILVELPDEEMVRRLLAQPPAEVQLFVPPPFEDPEPGRELLEHRPVVIGSGPAGLLAGYLLAWKGYRPLIIERGQPVKSRVPAIRAFEAGGEHDAENNYLFGEGGAGTFSDGKLTCRMSGPDVAWVLDRLVDCGGKPSLVYEQRPHLGSNRLPLIVRNFRRRIESLGGEYRFGCRLEGLDIVAGRLRGLHTSRGYIAATQAVLGIGHSARDTYAMLLAAGLPLQPKAFQLGLRIEQPQDQVNRHKYGRPEYLPLLGAADYTLAVHGQRDVYSFCMCAGGVTIPSVSEPGCLATNGMSNSRHDTPFANSGIMVTLEPHEFGSDARHGRRGIAAPLRADRVRFGGPRLPCTHPNGSRFPGRPHAAARAAFGKFVPTRHGGPEPERDLAAPGQRRDSLRAADHGPQVARRLFAPCQPAGARNARQFADSNRAGRDDSPVSRLPGPVPRRRGCRFRRRHHQRRRRWPAECQTDRAAIRPLRIDWPDVRRARIASFTASVYNSPVNKTAFVENMMPAKLRFPLLTALLSLLAGSWASASAPDRMPKRRQ